MNNTETADTVIGMFNTKSQADAAIDKLKAAGFDESEIGYMCRNPDGSVTKSGTQSDDGIAAGALTGAAVGAAGGAAVGAGILAGVIPVIGPVLAIGTLGTILVNAAGGAAAASLAGALAGWGFSNDEAEYYEREVNAGKHLVTVHSDSRRAIALRILDSGRSNDPAIRRQTPLE
jgi:hypothetical protein